MRWAHALTLNLTAMGGGVRVCVVGVRVSLLPVSVNEMLKRLVLGFGPGLCTHADARTHTHTHTHTQWVGLALGVEFIGLARCAALLGWAIEKCLPPSYMIPWNQDFEQCLHAVFQDLQNVRMLGLRRRADEWRRGKG